MNLEMLANELFLDLFEYLEAVHLFGAFYGLNGRFDNLLLIHFRLYRLDFRLVTNQKFDIIYEKYLPVIVDRIISLCLTNDELFLSRGFTLDQFNHLQTISLYGTNSFDLLNRLTSQCRHLLQLTHLNIIKCRLCGNDIDTSCFINNIWNLSQLTHFNLYESPTNEKLFSKISHVSSSIEHVSIKASGGNPNDLYNLILFTPRLQHLYTSISISPHNEFHTSHMSIISLKLDYFSTTQSLINFLRLMPNLLYLTINMHLIYVNGYEWEMIFLDHLPHIKIFRLKMNYNFYQTENKEDVVDQLLDSFSTHFWLKEHQWYVRCDWNPLIKNSEGLLYTLPYAFDNYRYCQPMCSKSTLSNDRTYWSYDRVHSLEHFHFIHPLNKWYLFRGFFPNILNLSIYVPFIDDLWSLIPTFYYLRSLEIVLLRDGDLVYSQLQSLFDRAANLYSLTIGINGSVPMDFSKMKSTSIHRLNFLYKMPVYTHSFDNTNCTALACSPLGFQCEVLFIEVENRTGVLDLIQQMTNLQSLTFQINDENENQANNELLKWLRNHLPSTCSVTKEIEDLYNIKVSKNH